MKGWYQAAVDRAPPPIRFNLRWITAERVDLYRHIPPLGNNITVFVEPLKVEESVTMEDKIEWAVKRLRNHCSGAPSGMRAEHLKGWFTEARNDESVSANLSETEGTTAVIGGTGRGEVDEIREKAPTEMTNWERVAALVRVDFGEGLLAEEATWQAVFLIPKGKWDYRGIGLV